MAYQSVPLAGTGEAVVFGQDTASQNYLRDVDLQRRQRELLAQKQAQDIAESYRNNMLSADSGKLFASELGDLEQKHLKQGMDYRAQGWDIYNPDPNNAEQMKAHETYMQDRRTIENLRAYRKGIEDDYKIKSQAIARATEGEYDPDVIKQINDIVSGGNLQDLYRSGGRLPDLQKKYSKKDALKGVTAPTLQTVDNEGNQILDKKVIDKQSAENTVISTMLSDPASRNYLLKITGGIDPRQIISLPNDLEGIKKVIRQDLEGDPAQKEMLASKQIKIGSKAYEDLVNNQAQQKLKIKNALTNDLEESVGIISEGANLWDKRKDAITPYQRYQMARNLRKDAEKDSSAVIESTDQTIPIQNKNVPARNIIRISPTAFNLGGLNGYDTQTDSDVNIPNVEGGVKLANIAWYPFSKSGVETTKNKLTGKESKRSIGGKLVQEDYASKNPNDIEYRPMALVSYTEGEGVLKKQKDILIPVDDLPKDKKDIQKRIATLKANAPKQTQQTTSGKSYSTKYGSFTEQQLKDAYGEAWKQALDKIKK